MSEKTYRDNSSDLDLEGRELARGSARQAEDNSSRIEKLERRLEHLSLITEALWDLLVTKLQIGSEQLQDEVDKVTASRERRRTEKAACEKCGMKVPAIKEKCMYCGALVSEKPAVSPFDR